MAKSFRFPRWVEKTRTYSIHPVAFIDQPAATPHQPRYAQQLPPRGKPRRHCRPGSPGWRPLPGSKAFGLQQPTGYHLFTIHSYLLLSPTQVGDAGRVREPTYRYRLRASLSGGTAAPLCISFREAWPRLVFFTFTGYNALVTFLKGAFRCKQKKMK